MRRYSVILFILSVLMVNVPVTSQEDDNQDTNLASALTAYNNGDYTLAAQYFENTIDESSPRANLYFNLGITYLQLDRIGPAILALRRAQQLQPRDPDIGRMLNTARSRRVDYQRDEVNLFDRITTSTYATATEDEMLWVTMVAWSVFFSAVGMMSLVRTWRRAIFPVVLVSAFFLFLVGGTLLIRLRTDLLRPPAVVTDLSTDVYSGPSEQYLTMFTVYSGAEIRVLDQNGAWVLIQLDDGRRGWVSRLTIDYV